MRSVVLAFFLSVMAAVVQGSCPHVCSCSAGVVDCSNRALTTATLPSSFPASTTELLLNENHLTALPAGLLDALPALRRVALDGNPWACDCAILFLRGWMLKHGSDTSVRNVSCSSPAHLRGRLIVYLPEQELLDSCRYRLCNLALASQISLLVFIGIQALLLASVILFLRRFERLTEEAQRTAAESFTAEENADHNSEYVMLKDRSM